MNIEDLNTNKNDNGNNLEPTNLNSIPNQNVPIPPSVTPTGADALNGAVPNMGGNGALENPAPTMTPPPVQPTPPQTPINLAPEGMQSQANQGASAVSEPLVGETLTSNSTFTGFNAFGQQPTNNLNNGMNNNASEGMFFNNTMNSNPSNIAPNPAPNNNLNTNTFNSANNIISGVNEPIPNTNPFGNSNQMPNNNLGVPTPPPFNTDGNASNKKPKKSKKTLIVLLVIILIFAVGAGVYYFLNYAKTSSVSKYTIVPTLTTWEKGEEFSKDVTKYAQITGENVTSCTVEVVKGDSSDSYKYTITCPNTTPVTSNLNVKDSKGPVVKLKDLTVKPNTEVNPEDFIDSCKDATIANGCDIELAKGETIDTSTEGEFEVSLEVSDDYDNKTEVKAKLIVSNSVPAEVLRCTIKDTSSAIENATLTENYEYDLSETDELISIRKIDTYKFTDKESYDELKKTYTDMNNTLNNAGASSSGDTEFDDDNLTIKITETVTSDELAVQYGLDAFPNNLDGIATFHESEGRKDVCTIS